MNFAYATRSDGPDSGPKPHGVLGIIPARLASTRLPDKPLHLLLGRPLIEWVWRRASAMTTLDAVVIATDSEAVVDVCRGFGATVAMTRAEHPSGTDRIAEVAERPPFAGYEVVVNIQGDEPLLREEHVAAAIDLVRRGWDVGTCATPIRSPEARVDPSTVKVARAESGQALYFSRAPIPFRRDGDPTLEQLTTAPFLRHVGLYAYSRAALKRWVGLPPSPLEQIEMLEQLRPLEAGMSIGVAVVESAEAGVDTPADALRTEQRLRDLGFHPVTEHTGAS